MMSSLLRACILATLLVALLPGAALASCAPAPPLHQAFADAEVVFKGTVTEVENEGRTATVRVEEVWKGAPLEGSVIVVGGPEDENIASSVDRTFKVMETYLFFPTNLSAPFKDNICTSTQIYSPELDRLRDPSSVSAGGEPSSEGESLPFTGSSHFPLLAAGALLTVGGSLLAARRSRSR